MAFPRKETDLSARISSFINTAPDYGEEDDDLTRAQQLIPAQAQSDESGDELNLAQFRKINIELLDDKRYKGLRTSRKDLEEEKAFGSDSGDEFDNDIDTGSVTSGSTREGSGEESNSDDEEISEDDELHDKTIGKHEDKKIKEEEDDGNENLMSNKVVDDLSKGNAIRNQFSAWDTLLECRIKFQKCLTIANKLPQVSTMDAFKELGGEDFKNAQKISQNSLKKVLNSLLILESAFHQLNTKHFQEDSKAKEVDDENITSDSDDEGEVEEDGANAAGFHKFKKRRRLTDFSNEIRERHNNFTSFRNETIQKWNDKTRTSQLGSKDFSAFEQSTLKQIEIILADKQRLLKRTRTMRSTYHILGEDDGPPSKLSKVEECNEIFDDDDFYHQLLRELLERKTTDVTDPVHLSRQWIQLQKARNKMKKQVDTKASKGRKLRYNVHQKLVNFMMPIDTTTWSDESKKELFSSIFGQKEVTS